MFAPRPARRFDGARHEQTMAEVWVGLETEQTTALVPSRTRQICDGLLQRRRLQMRQIRVSITRPIAVCAVGVTNGEWTAEDCQMPVSDAVVGARLGERAFRKARLATLRALTNIEQTFDAVVQQNLDICIETQTFVTQSKKRHYFKLSRCRLTPLSNSRAETQPRAATRPPPRAGRSARRHHCKTRGPRPRKP